MSEPIIKVDNLRKVYKLGTQKVVALDNINLEIYPGEICCILGTSGSGKSTLLNMLAGLEKPSRGNVFINNSSISQMSEKELVDFRQKYLGFVFQSYNLINSMTALENVTLPLVFKGKNKGKTVPKTKKNLRLFPVLKKKQTKQKQKQMQKQKQKQRQMQMRK